MLPGGALDGPQVVAILMVLAGGLVLMERARTVEGSGFPPIPQKEAEWMGHGTLWIRRNPKGRSEIEGPGKTEVGAGRCAECWRTIEVPAEAKGQRLDQFLAGF